MPSASDMTSPSRKGTVNYYTFVLLSDTLPGNFAFLLFMLSLFLWSTILFFALLLSGSLMLIVN